MNPIPPLSDHPAPVPQSRIEFVAGGLIWGADVSDATQGTALLADYKSSGKGVFQKLVARDDGNTLSDY